MFFISDCWCLSLWVIMAPCSRHFERRPNESHVCGWVWKRQGGLRHVKVGGPCRSISVCMLWRGGLFLIFWGEAHILYVGTWRCLMPHTVVPCWRAAVRLVLRAVAGTTSELSAHAFTEVTQVRWFFWNQILSASAGKRESGSLFSSFSVFLDGT